MMEKTSDDRYSARTEYSTNIKMGVIKDTANKTELDNLLRFKPTEYVERMEDEQESLP